MKPPPTPAGEADRQAELASYDVLDTPPEPAFDALTRLAAHIAGVPIALVSLVDADRQWFKSRYGLEAPETPRDISFCGHVVAAGAPLVVGDASLDERFADNPLVTGDPRVRFYLGIPLTTPSGHVLGTLCAIDDRPRQLTAEQTELLALLAQQAVDQLELRRRSLALARQQAELRTAREFLDLAVEMFATTTADGLHFAALNPAWERTLGWTLDELRAAPFTSFVHPDDLATTIAEASRLISEHGSTVLFENRYRHRDGRWVTLSWMAAAKDGIIYASARDVTVLAERRARLEAALDEASTASARLRSVLGSANYSIIETTPDGTIREFNAAAERMLGYAAAEVVGKTTPAILHDADEVVARAAVLSAELGRVIEPGFEVFVAKARAGQADEREWTYLRKDGARFPVELSVTARRNEQGEITGFLGIASDIRARRQAEGALAERTSLLALSARVAIAFTLDRPVTHMLQECAEAMVEHLDAALARIWLLDDEPQELVLKASAGLYTHTDGADARVPVGRFKIGTIAAERRPHLTNDVVGDPLVRDPAWARREGMVAFAGYPLLLDDRLIGVMALYSRHPLDQTVMGALGVVATSVAVGIQRKTAEADLRESEIRARSIVSTAVDPIITIDASGRIDQVNPAGERAFGYAAAELVGQNVNVLMPSPHHEHHDVYLAAYKRTGIRKVIGVGREIVGRRRDGTTFPADLSVSEYEIDGRTYFTGVVRDISERKQIDRLQAEFISTVSHELRTPLTSIRGSLGLVAAGVTGELPAEAKEYVDIALANSDRLVRLINDILDMEKMQAGSMEFRFASLDLAAAVRGAIAANAAVAAGYQVRLALNGHVAPGEVLADADRLAQVLTNLISNAAKFSPPGSEVSIEIRRIERRMRVTVRDRGPGISDEFRGRIFQRFAQADASTTRQRGGTGLGLSIAKTIIERMRGRIGFEAAEGGGTVFFFELPYLAPVEGRESSPPGPRVLVCEDDPDVMRILERILSEAGFVVDSTPTLERARRLLAAREYAAITLDLVLADGDGGDLIRELRASPATRALPIIVVSGADSELGSAALLVSDLIAKPFDEVQLLESVRAAIASCRSSAPRLLHVEDDEDIRRVVKRTLPRGWTVVAADSLEAARRALASTTFDLVLLDLSLPDGGGEELLPLVGSARVIVFSASDAPADLSRRVAASLVKSLANPSDLRDTIVSLLAQESGLHKGGT